VFQALLLVYRDIYDLVLRQHPAKSKRLIFEWPSGLVKVKARQSLISRPLLYDEALVTSLYRFGETDCIVRLFTRHQGRVNMFYKRGLEPRRDGQGTLVTLGLARIGYIIGSDQRMARLYTIEPDPRCLLLASSLKLFAYTSYLAELIEKLLPENEVAESIFELILETHNALLNQGPQSYILRALELKLLNYLGYLPELPEPKNSYFYDPMGCRFMNNPETNYFEISKLALALARNMLLGPWESFAHAQKPELMMIARIFHGRLKLLGLLPLKSMAFFKRL
jgi:hypothetical protein